MSTNGDDEPRREPGAGGGAAPKAAGGAGADGEAFELFLRLSPSSASSAAAPAPRVRVTGLSGTSSVRELRSAIARLLPDAPVERQRLVHKGRLLGDADDALPLHRLNVAHQSTLYLVVAPAPAAAAAASPPRPPQAPPHRPARAAFQPPPPPALPPPGQWPAQDLLDSPLVRRLLDDRPDFLADLLRSQLESNPALRRMMDDNPSLRHLLADPAALRQAAELARNPDAMRQAMRQQDLALSQLENMPGGFAALSNMYRNVQAPLEESLSEAAPSPFSGEGGAGASTSSTAAGATGRAMPNPWGSAAPPLRTSPLPPPQPSTTAAPSSSSNRWGVPPRAEDALSVLRNLQQDPYAGGGWSGWPGSEPGASNPSPSSPSRSFSGLPNPWAPPGAAAAAAAPNPWAAPVAAPPPPPTGGLDFSSLLQSGGGGASAPTSPPPHRVRPQPPPADPRQRYRIQLRLLADMGFDDADDAVLAALQAERGNVNRAVDRLLADPTAPPQPQAPSPADGQQRDGSAANNNNNNGSENHRRGAPDDVPQDAPPKDASQKKND